MPLPQREPPDTLKPYLSLGVDLNWKDGDEQTSGECPFCAKPKFSVNIETGQYRCWSCGTGNEKQGGNAFVFMERFYELCEQQSTPVEAYKKLAAEREYDFFESLIRWGLVQSALTGEWLVPGYDIYDKIRQLYRYVQTEKRMVLKPVWGKSHQLMGTHLYSPSCSTVWICEGPWDAIALWECLKQHKLLNDKPIETANESASILGFSSVLATPGCKVFYEEWAEKYCAGKVVNIMFDSDMPKKHPQTGKMLRSAGMDGMEYVAYVLLACHEPPSGINYVRWGKDGYHPPLPDGFDIRDALAKSHAPL